jgi:beta-1,2-mannobiose phosphorylase / 1,2-beta-oligomannan phosphorylase
MVPVGVERLGVALEPEEQWERHRGGGGVEDPRVSFVPALDRWVMTYTGWGPLGPRIALAASADLVRWERLGPVGLAFDPAEPLLEPELPDERQGVVPPFR